MTDHTTKRNIQFEEEQRQACCGQLPRVDKGRAGQGRAGQGTWWSGGMVGSGVCAKFAWGSQGQKEWEWMEMLKFGGGGGGEGGGKGGEGGGGVGGVGVGGGGGQFTWDQLEQHKGLPSTHLQDPAPCRLRSSGTSVHLLHLLYWLTSLLNRAMHDARNV